MVTINPAKLSFESVYAIRNSNITYGYRPEPEYNDPLAKWPLRGLAFSSDVGMALKNFSPLLTTLLWIPTIGYLGADIYDKYQYDKGHSNPDAKRALKETIFQSMASVISPLILVAAGQKTAEFVAKHDKYKLSDKVFNVTEKVLKKFKKNAKISPELKMKLFKTAGGFASIALFAIPIDKFVEKSVMKKIEPKIDKLDFNS